MRVVTGILGLRRERRRGQFAPLAGAIAAPQFGAEMPEIESGVERVALGQDRAHRVAEKMRFDDVPCAAAAREFEQSFAGSDMEPLCHSLLP